MALVFLVHDDPVFQREAAVALRDAGHEVATFDDPMTALNALEGDITVDVLVTRVNFPEGKPNGVSLALMTRMKCLCVFVSKSENERWTEGIGRLVPHPVDLAELVRTVDAVRTESSERPL